MTVIKHISCHGKLMQSFKFIIIKVLNSYEINMISRFRCVGNCTRVWKQQTMVKTHVLVLNKRMIQASRKTMSDNLTLEKAVQALDKVKSEFEVENGRLAIITPDRYADTYDMMANHFTPAEPLCRSFGVVWEKEHERVINETLTFNVSICMISEDSNEIIGVLVNGIIKISDPPMDLSKYDYEPLRSLFTFLTHKDKEDKFFEHFGVHKAVYFFALGVNRNYRRIGLGGRILAAAVAMSRELGFKACKVEGTSNFSQRIIEKQGFETLYTLPYDSYMYNGRPVIDGTGEHTQTKIYGLRL